MKILIKYWYGYFDTPFKEKEVVIQIIQKLYRSLLRALFHLLIKHSSILVYYLSVLGNTKNTERGNAGESTAEGAS